MQDVARCVGLPKEAIVSDEVELIADGNGVAVIGEKTAVEQFLAGAGMEAKELDLSMLRTGMSRERLSLRLELRSPLISAGG